MYFRRWCKKAKFKEKIIIQLSEFWVQTAMPVKLNDLQVLSKCAMSQFLKIFIRSWITYHILIVCSLSLFWPLSAKKLPKWALALKKGMCLGSQYEILRTRTAQWSLTTKFIGLKDDFSQIRSHRISQVELELCIISHRIFYYKTFLCRE